MLSPGLYISDITTYSPQRLNPVLRLALSSRLSLAQRLAIAKRAGVVTVAPFLV